MCCIQTCDADIIFELIWIKKSVNIYIKLNKNMNMQCKIRTIHKRIICNTYPKPWTLHVYTTNVCAVMDRGVSTCYRSI